MTRNKLWIMYDNSPARLPLYVANSSTELAKVAGVSEFTVRTTASRVNTGKCLNGRFAVVNVENIED